MRSSPTLDRPRRPASVQNPHYACARIPTGFSLFHHCPPLPLSQTMLVDLLRVAVVAALLVSTVEAAPRGARFSKRAPAVGNIKRSMTNAERLARGLTPNPPRFDSPSTCSLFPRYLDCYSWAAGVARVRRSGPSGVPQPPVMSVTSCPADGFIKVANPDGYFDNAPGASGAPVGLVTDTADAGVYRIDPCSSEPFAITCTVRHECIR